MGFSEIAKRLAGISTPLVPFLFHAVLGLRLEMSEKNVRHMGLEPGFTAELAEGCCSHPSTAVAGQKDAQAWRAGELPASKGPPDLPP